MRLKSMSGAPPPHCPCTLCCLCTFLDDVIEKYVKVQAGFGRCSALWSERMNPCAPGALAASAVKARFRASASGSRQ